MLRVLTREGLSEAGVALQEKWRRGYEGLAQLIAQHIYGRVLEAGAGRGQLTQALLRYHENLVALDASPGELFKLKQSCHVTAVAGAFEALPFAAGSFNCVVSNFTAGWLNEEHLLRALKEFKRVLAKGGVAILSDFYPEARSKAEEVALLQGLPENNLLPSEKWWHPEEIAALAAKAGFEEEKLAFYDWGIRFTREEAILQLTRWHAKQEFIGRIDALLSRHGMALPQSYVLMLR